MSWVDNLATSLVGSGVVALSVFLLERHYAARAAKRDLQHMLGTGKNFVGIDLRGRDLAGSYLAGKDFRGGRFDGANLEGANLFGTDLSQASLIGANLKGANFKGPPPPLYPSENLYPSPHLYPMGTPAGVQPLPDANLRGADITDAKYDSSTAWPENYDPAEHGAVLCEARRSLQYRLSSRRPRFDALGPQEGAQRPQEERSWWRRMFGG
jgi:hypothetical protein